MRTRITSIELITEDPYKAAEWLNLMAKPFGSVNRLKNLGDLMVAAVKDRASIPTLADALFTQRRAGGANLTIAPSWIRLETSGKISLSLIQGMWYLEVNFGAEGSQQRAEEVLWALGCAQAEPEIYGREGRLSNFNVLDETLKRLIEIGKRSTSPKYTDQLEAAKAALEYYRQFMY